MEERVTGGVLGHAWTNIVAAVPQNDRSVSDCESQTTFLPPSPLFSSSCSSSCFFFFFQWYPFLLSGSLSGLSLGRFLLKKPHCKKK